MVKTKESLSELETKDFQSFEKVIAKGLQTFYDVGNALSAIRDKKLYRNSFKTFEDYCLKRWGMSKPRAYQLIQAADITENLSTIVDKNHINEGQIRELASVPAHEQKLVYQLANELTEGKVTGSAIRSLAAIANGVIATGYVEIDDGVQKPWVDLEPEEKRSVLMANLEKETYERMQQHKQRGSLSKSMQDPIQEKIWLKKEQFAELCDLACYAPGEERDAYERKWKHDVSKTTKR